MKIRLFVVLFAILSVTSITTPSSAETTDKDTLLGEMMGAEMYSFSLEDLIFKIKDEFTSRKAVYDFYRQGFGPSISEKLTNNIWNDDKIKLQPGDRIMELPKNVSYSNVTVKSANISFTTPSNRKHVWGNSEFTELILKREDGRWKLFEKE